MLLNSVCQFWYKSNLFLVMENKSTAEDAISTQKSLSASHDPGWNDPPKWAYSPSSDTTNSTPVKRTLNKRVPFPLASAPPTSNFDPYQPLSPPPVNMPPPPQSTSYLTITSQIPLSAPSTIVANNNSTDAAINKEQTLKNSLANLDFVINNHEELRKESEDIKKRLEMMKTLWREDKLNNCIYKKVLDISEALRSRDVETADRIHISLMMDHATLCSSWIPGIRHLILRLKGKTNIQEVNPSPYLLPTPAMNTPE